MCIRDSNIPTLVIAGQNELNELPDYAGLLGQDIYFNTPEATAKILYEIENGGHSSAEFPVTFIGNKTLAWAKYILRNNEVFCDSLLVSPENSSQYLNTLQCGEGLNYDLNEDGELDNADLIELVIAVLNSFEIHFDINNDQVTNIFDILVFSSFLDQF